MLRTNNQVHHVVYPKNYEGELKFDEKLRKKLELIYNLTKEGVRSHLIFVNGLPIEIPSGLPFNYLNAGSIFDGLAMDTAANNENFKRFSQEEIEAFGLLEGSIGAELIQGTRILFKTRFEKVLSLKSHIYFGENYFNFVHSPSEDLIDDYSTGLSIIGVPKSNIYKTHISL